MGYVKIRLITSVAGTEYTFAAGQEVDAPESIARDLIQGGHAVPVATTTAQRAEKQPPPAAQAEKRSSK